MLERKISKDFAAKLLEWWRDNKRDFPWRTTRDPYRVLIAEVLLRKTTVAQVVKLYEKFIEKYPNPKALAEASREQLEQLLRPLGMEHRRAELLVRLGRAVVERHGGAVPCSAEDLMKLPGVGRYAANAVLCLACGADEPMVDANAVRLLQRFFGLKTSRTRARDDPELWRFAGSLIPRGMGREFNLAVIDFAGVVCTARSPKCGACPLKDLCYCRSRGVQP